ncbi:MAG: autoinducer synthesis protein [Gammaproteobacteria bacterium]|nr:autoinducer synthesis protein [Gammaproteobacteria bacterium]
MNTVITNHANHFTFHPGLIKSMYQLRDRVFRCRLGWDVTSTDGNEKDQYDEINPVYMMSCNESKQLEGCWRILPTTGPYMLRDIFPELLRGEELPEHENIWELSRLAVDPQKKHFRFKGNMNEITLDLFRNIYEYGIKNNIKRYVAVTSTPMERILRLNGIPTTRFGDGKTTRIGNVNCLCIWIDVNDELRQAVYKPFKLDDREAA